MKTAKRPSGLVLYTIQMRPGLRAAIKSAAAQDERSVSVWLRRALARFVDDYDFFAKDDGPGTANFTLEFPPELIDRLKKCGSRVYVGQAIRQAAWRALSE